MRILAITWTTINSEEALMINARGDLICPAIDGITNELLKLGHQVVYVNCYPEKTKCLAMISGLPYREWDEIKNRNFDLVWHAIKDPTPEVAIPYIKKVMKDIPDIPVLNNIEQIKTHTKRKYITKLREKGVGAIILDDYDWTDWKNKTYPPSNNCYVSKDYYAIRLGKQNNNVGGNLFSDEFGITLRYQNTAKRPDAKPGMRSFFRVPYACGKCLEGTMYYCPESVLCPKSGAAVIKEPYSLPEMAAGSVAAAMNELGVDIAHIEGVLAGFSVEIFDVNPFPTSYGATLYPMSQKIVKRIEQVWNI